MGDQALKQLLPVVEEEGGREGGRFNDPFYGELDTKCDTIPIICFVTLGYGNILKPLKHSVIQQTLSDYLCQALF